MLALLETVPGNARLSANLLATTPEPRRVSKGKEVA